MSGVYTWDYANGEQPSGGAKKEDAPDRAFVPKVKISDLDTGSFRWKGAELRLLSIFEDQSSKNG